MNILKILLNKRKIVKDHIFYYTVSENIIGDPKKCEIIIVLSNLNLHNIAIAMLEFSLLLLVNIAIQI